MFGTCLFLVAGELNSGVISGKSNLLSWNKITLGQHDTCGHSWVSHSLNGYIRSRSLPWIMESLVQLKWKSILWYSFCQQRAQFDQRCLCRHQKRGAWGCVALCVYVHVYLCMLFHVLFISHPVIHTECFPGFSSFFLFPKILPCNPLDFPHLPSMFKCTVIQSPQDSAKKWALLLSTPRFIWENSAWDDRLLRSIIL